MMHAWFVRVAAIFQTLLVYWDKRSFRSVRADYFDYLSASIKGARGRHSLRDIFDKDAHRYATQPRGRLAASWSQTYQESGGDLYATWSGCVPASELALVRVAQLAGNDALVDTLRDLAHVAGLSHKAGYILRSTVWSALLSLLILCGMVLAIPAVTVPRLAGLFDSLPPEYFGSWTRALFSFSTIVEAVWLPVLILTAGVAFLVCWSMANLTGPFRRFLDRWFLWRIYRSLGALGFMSFLKVMLQHRESGSTQLRTALTMLGAGASPWLRDHLDEMVNRIDHGFVGADTFDTGLLERELYWYLQDMIDARGLAGGVGLLCERLDERVLPQVERQAQTLRWSLLLACVAGMLMLGLWHYATIDELRRSMMIFYASR